MNICKDWRRINMEEYKVDSSELIKKNKSIKLGSYFDKVYEKHVDSYGEFGAENIRDNIIPTFKMALEQYLIWRCLQH